MDLERIKQKIKNLLARDVEHGATPEEAGVCLAKAQKLLEEFNLDIAEVLNYDKEAIKEDEASVSYGIARMPEFKIFINRMAKVYDCQVLTRSRYITGQRYASTYYTFTGTVINTEYAKYMLQVVLDILENSWNNYKDSEHYREACYFDKPRRVQNSFYRGFLLKVTNTCLKLYETKQENLKKEKAVENSSSYALMVLNNDKIEQYFKSIGVTTSRIHTNNYGKGEAYGAKNKGSEAGNAVNFGRPVEGKANKLLV